MSLPVVVVDPFFRTMSEIFDDETHARLRDRFRLEWAMDEPMPSDDFLAAAKTADAVVFGGWRHEQAGLDALGPDCRALLEVAGGHEHAGLDYRSALDRGLLIGSCAPAFGPAVAEHGMALALASMRGVVDADRGVRVGSERWLHAGNRDNASMLGATVGFVGCGSISRHLQRMLEPFGVLLLGYDPPLGRDALIDRGIEPVDLPRLFDRCDVIFVLAAPTAGNRHLVDAHLLGRLGAHQTVVLLSRGSLVDFDAVLEFGGPGSFRFASDVFPEEPLAADDPIRTLDNTVRTPHLAGALPTTLHEIGRCVVDDLDAIFEGREPARMQYLTAASFGGLVQEGIAPRADADEP